MVCMHHAHAKSAVVLLSGGLDSATTLAIAQARGYRAHALSFAYSQRHAVELDAARDVAQALGVAEHRWAKIDPALFRGSALTDAIDVPKDRPDSRMVTDIPPTYVPARNTIFLSYALAYAEAIHSADIFIGVNAVDYSGYPDCRPEYIAAYQRMANLATKAGVEREAKLSIHAPLMDLRKSEIIHRGVELGVDYVLTHSCYDPDECGRPCTRCDACRLRQSAFTELGMTDPLLVKYEIEHAQT